MEFARTWTVHDVTAPQPEGRRRAGAAVVSASLLAIGALYVARPVLIPLALAVLVAFQSNWRRQ